MINQIYLQHLFRSLFSKSKKLSRNDLFVGLRIIRKTVTFTWLLSLRKLSCFHTEIGYDIAHISRNLTTSIVTSQYFKGIFYLSLKPSDGSKDSKIPTP